MAPLPQDGFIAHYLAGVVYPASWTTAIDIVVLVAVIGSWMLFSRESLRR